MIQKAINNLLCGEPIKFEEVDNARRTLELPEAATMAEITWRFDPDTLWNQTGKLK